MKYVSILALMAAALWFTTGCSSNPNPQDSNSADSTADSVAQAAPGRQADYYYAFDENSDIFVGNSPDDLEIVDVNGYNCTISPDGKRVAYTNYVSEHRCICVYDIKSKNNKFLNFPVDNEVYMGSFSPDGNYLAVNYMAGANWTIAIYDLVRDTICYCQKDGNNDYFSPTFSPDGKKLLFHDMEKVYINDFANGRFVQKEVIGCDNFCQLNDMGVSSASMFQINDSGDYIYFLYDNYRGGGEGYSSLASYKVDNGEVKMISPKVRGNVLDFHLASDGSLYMLMMQKTKDETANLFVCRQPDMKPVKVSPKNFQTPCSFYVAY